MEETFLIQTTLPLRPFLQSWLLCEFVSESVNSFNFHCFKCHLISSINQVFASAAKFDIDVRRVLFEASFLKDQEQT